MSQAFTPSSNDRVIAEIAAQCVMCGLCLPHCPSYAVTRNEAESPRGRLALMARIASGEISTERHPSLDSCLACGRCERVCPPKVAFVEALTRTRHTYARANERWSGKLARRLSRQPSGLRRLLRMAMAARALLPRAMRRKVNLDGFVATTGNTATTALPATHANVRTTLVLASCAADTLESRALDAMQRIANRCGIRLRVERDTCCGALDRHLGFTAVPQATIATGGTTQIVAINAGCTAQWRQCLAPREVVAVATWLEDLLDSHTDRLATKPLRVALHLPCTQQGLAGEADAMRRLIDRLPGAMRIELPAQPGCCGAAGTYFLNQPEISRQLGDITAQQIRATEADVVVSANGGCRAQLAQALFDLDVPVRLLHPAELIAEYLTGP